MALTGASSCVRLDLARLGRAMGVDGIMDRLVASLAWLDCIMVTGSNGLDMLDDDDDDDARDGTASLRDFFDGCITLVSLLSVLFDGIRVSSPNHMDGPRVRDRLGIGLVADDNDDAGAAAGTSRAHFRSAAVAAFFLRLISLSISIPCIGTPGLTCIRSV
jgi:hypothetical protein